MNYFVSFCGKLLNRNYFEIHLILFRSSIVIVLLLKYEFRNDKKYEPHLRLENFDFRAISVNGQLKRMFFVFIVSTKIES